MVQTARKEIPVGHEEEIPDGQGSLAVEQIAEGAGRFFSLETIKQRFSWHLLEMLSAGDAIGREGRVLDELVSPFQLCVSMILCKERKHPPHTLLLLSPLGQMYFRGLERGEDFSELWIDLRR